VAIVYEWQAKTDDVAVALSSAEFFERRGTSLSGKFVPVEELARDIDNGKRNKHHKTECWSATLVREWLAKEAPGVNPLLL
jgi:hypothetical protein